MSPQRNPFQTGRYPASTTYTNPTTVTRPVTGTGPVAGTNPAAGVGGVDEELFGTNHGPGPSVLNGGNGAATGGAATGGGFEGGGFEGGEGGGCAGGNCSGGGQGQQGQQGQNQQKLQNAALIAGLIGGLFGGGLGGLGGLGGGQGGNTDVYTDAQKRMEAEKKLDARTQAAISNLENPPGDTTQAANDSIQRLLDDKELHVTHGVSEQERKERLENDLKHLLGDPKKKTVAKEVKDRFQLDTDLTIVDMARMTRSVAASLGHRESEHDKLCCTKKVYLGMPYKLVESIYLDGFPYSDPEAFEYLGHFWYPITWMESSRNFQNSGRITKERMQKLLEKRERLAVDLSNERVKEAVEMMKKASGDNSLEANADQAKESAKEIQDLVKDTKKEALGRYGLFDGTMNVSSSVEPNTLANDKEALEFVALKIYDASEQYDKSKLNKDAFKKMPDLAQRIKQNQNRPEVVSFNGEAAEYLLHQKKIAELENTKTDTNPKKGWEEYQDDPLIAMKNNLGDRSEEDFWKDVAGGKKEADHIHWFGKNTGGFVPFICKTPSLAVCALLQAHRINVVAALQKYGGQEQTEKDRTFFLMEFRPYEDQKKGDKLSSDWKGRGTTGKIGDKIGIFAGKQNPGETLGGPEQEYDRIYRHYEAYGGAESSSVWDDKEDRAVTLYNHFTFSAVCPKDYYIHPESACFVLGERKERIGAFKDKPEDSAS